MTAARKKIKLDAINRKILTITHTHADISNQELADLIGLSNSACFQRVKALREAGYFLSFNTDLDLNRMVHHVLAYVEFTLVDNGHDGRVRFEAAIEEIPEFMDCFRISGDTDYICFTCCSTLPDLSKLTDDLTADQTLGIRHIKTRVILDRAKWYLGYPLDRLKWLDDG